MHLIQEQESSKASLKSNNKSEKKKWGEMGNEIILMMGFRAGLALLKIHTLNHPN